MNVKAAIDCEAETTALVRPRGFVSHLSRQDLRLSENCVEVAFLAAVQRPLS